MDRPLFIGLTGKPGCGKGSRIEQLSRVESLQASWESFGMGDLVRSVLDNPHHRFHKAVKEFYETASPAAILSNDFILPLLEEKLGTYFQRDNLELVVIDGVTRDVEQNPYLDHLIVHEADDAIVAKRIEGRLNSALNTFAQHYGLSNGTIPTKTEIKSAFEEKQGELFELIQAYNTYRKELELGEIIRGDDLYHQERLVVFHDTTQPAIDAFDKTAISIIPSGNEVVEDVPIYEALFDHIATQRVLDGFPYSYELQLLPSARNNRRSDFYRSPRAIPLDRLFSK